MTNIPNLTRLRDWLLAGAPHHLFSMQYGLITTSAALNSTEDGELHELEGLSQIELNKPGVGDCGTVCCIAGAAAMLDGMEPSTNGDSWPFVRARALRALDLPDDPNNWMGHDLFDPDCAPDNCTPTQAAEAVQNVMEGRAPWN